MKSKWRYSEWIQGIFSILGGVQVLHDSRQKMKLCLLLSDLLLAKVYIDDVARLGIRS